MEVGNKTELSHCAMDWAGWRQHGWCYAGTKSNSCFWIDSAAVPAYALAEQSPCMLRGPRLVGFFVPALFSSLQALLAWKASKKASRSFL